MSVPMRILLLPFLTLGLFGCASLLQTPYAPPRVDTPAQWQAAHEVAPNASPRWWEAVGDPALNRLEEAVLAHNTNLAAAALLVQRARLQAGLSAEAERPVLSATANASETLALRDTAPNTRSTTLAAGLSFELDLWGKLARTTDAARWEAEATAQDRESAALSLTGTTARLYWQLGLLNERVRLADENIAGARRSLDVVTAQKAAGSASRLDVALAAQALANLEAARSDLVQQRSEARNALAILFDAPPEQAAAEPQTLPDAALPTVDAGLPAELLGRRPDLRAAELRLRKLLASSDATRASYYPSFSLTGSLGSTSNALTNVLSNPAATLGAGLNLPFLQWRSMHLAIQVSQKDYEKAVIDFRQTLHGALSEVENALAARQSTLSQGEQLAKALANAEAAEALYAVQYRAGALPLRTWLDAQQSRREARAAVLNNRYNRLANHATLCLALGGAVIAAE